MTGMPQSRTILGDTGDRMFWMTVRQALKLIVTAIEKRYLPELKNGRHGNTT